jgi:hypothetical protein
MSKIKVPDFMPVLKAGKHTNPSQGACIMEYISVLAGERFTDRPLCVHPQLAHMARTVNDYMGDDDQARQLLLPLVHRLMGTGGHLPPHQAMVVDRALSEIEYDPLWSYAIRGRSPHEKVKWLVKAIDAYDRITGRQCPDPISEDRLREATQKLKVGATVGSAEWSPTITITNSKVIWGTPASKASMDAELEAMLMAYATKKHVISA